MPNSTGRLAALALASLLATPLLAQMAASGPTAAPTSGSDRLFLSFAEDAAVVEGQWWEGRAEFTDWDELDSMVLRGIVAFQMRPDVEVGGTVGFGSTDSTTAGVEDGTGATDLDAWVKYRLGDSQVENTEFAIGGNLIIPTGDDTAGLGYDAFAVGMFGSVRYRLKSVILAGNLGIQLNGDGSTLGSPEADGEFAPWIGLGAIFPLSDRVGLVGEARWASERFEGFDDDFRVLGGVNWRASSRGQIRAAVVVGGSDGAPDTQFLAGYAARF